MWDLGFIIGNIIAVVLFGLSLWGYIASRKRWQKEPDRVYGARFEWAVAKWVLFGMTLLVPVVAAISNFPYAARYHMWVPVSGSVQSVESRLIGTGDGMEEAFLVYIDGKAYRVDDTRAAGLKEGDDVSLSCKQTWQYAAAEGTICRWNS